jgi:hypothetical protein
MDDSGFTCDRSNRSYEIVRMAKKKKRAVAPGEADIVAARNSALQHANKRL